MRQPVVFWAVAATVTLPLAAVIPFLPAAFLLHTSGVRLLGAAAARGRAVSLSRVNRHGAAVADWDQTIALDDGQITDEFRLIGAIMLARAGVPSLLIHGDTDIVPLEAIRVIARGVPGSRLVVLADCGHFAYLEQPEAVRSAITEFLSPG